MAITIYSDVFLPRRVIESGVRGRNIRKNSRVGVDSGNMSINIVWSQGLREYEVGFSPMSRLAWQDIETVHEITEGGAFGFLLEDPKDAYVSLGVMYQLTSTTFQLYKRYLHAGSLRYKDRKITRPKVTDFAPLESSTPIVTYTLDDETGIITIPSAPAAEDLSWTGGFYVPVHFKDDEIDWQMVVPNPSPDARFISGPTLVLREVRE
jgi:uncharacterized protein (TIGR02217 family)